MNPDSQGALRGLVLVLSVLVAALLAGLDPPTTGGLTFGRLHSLTVVAAAIGGGLPGSLFVGLLYAGIKAALALHADVATDDVIGDFGVRFATDAGIGMVVSMLVRSLRAREARIQDLEATLARRRAQE